MSQFHCLLLVLICLVATIGYIVYSVKVRHQHLRRTANDDMRLLKEQNESPVPSLLPTINGLIATESAFASVTVGSLFVVVNLIMSGGVALSDAHAPIVHAAIAALAIAAVSWILSLEMLSHLISPSYPPTAFASLYQEALNLWNVGLMLLLLSLSLVLIPVNTAVAATVAVLSMVLSMRTLALVHQWWPARIVEMTDIVVSPPRADEKRAKPWVYTAGLVAIAAALSPLYFALNRDTGNVLYMSMQIDEWIPFVPQFAVPYLSYFIYIASVALLLLVHKDRVAIERLALSVIGIFAVSYLLYAFMQTGMHRPDISGARGWSIGLVSTIYGSDNPYNAFPSSHASVTTACCAALWHYKRFRLLFFVWAALIIASTVLIKQHYLLDLLAGVALGLVSTLIAASMGRSRNSLSSNEQMV